MDKNKDIILPLTVIRRLDTVPEATKKKVLETTEKYNDKLNDLTALLISKQNAFPTICITSLAN
ncbi:MAG: type I restriction-modification system subunit M N-terminal domain-containing protein [Bacteroidota bacterium]